MAEKRLFGNRISPACKYCEQGRLSFDRSGAVLCERKGVVAPDYKCRHYRYDPLKREPRRRAPLQKFSQSDFEL
ncbi:hypothetical protein LJC63_12490 [Ruminococcaceae bacterium OttesenSCG-928-L11]|nr:hypothetical protein [Ruminococcaceae bacterium OttesenSCG-928-L11]